MDFRCVAIVLVGVLRALIRRNFSLRGTNNQLNSPEQSGLTPHTRSIKAQITDTAESIRMNENKNNELSREQRETRASNYSNP